MKHIITFLICICCVPVFTWASVSEESLLEELDKVISNKKHYHEIREKRLVSLKEKLNRTPDTMEKYRICDSLFNEYLHYQADSALIYVNRKLGYSQMLADSELVSEAQINKAEIYGVMGMYGESINELKKADMTSADDTKLKTYHYKTKRAYYGWLADYVADLSAKKVYAQKTEIYRDSIAKYTTNPLDDSINAAEKLIYGGYYMKAVEALQPFAKDMLMTKSGAYLHYTLSEAYQAVGDTAKQIIHLAKTAIIDLKMAEREYASLQKLALLIFEKGDLDRAYRYLTCSMEDAVAANARLRFLEITTIYPIIDKAYKTKEAEERAFSNRLLIGISILAFLLVIATFYLYYWMKKLAEMRRNLYHANKQLVEANDNLLQAGKIKDVYIARYLDRCVTYLDKLEQYRRSLEKLAMASKTVELFKAIRSEEFLKEERRTFYSEFDKSFLGLFPNFVDDFNNLLQDDAKIYPKKDEQLSTELRIFALIRLGVTDANRIAHFLGYSVATVYNYRSKIRNKAKGDKEMFEQDVMDL